MAMVQKGNRAEAAFLITATAVGAFLRFYRIGKECLWFDEICTTWRASLPFNGIIDNLTGTIVFPPLYFFLVKIWLHLAGLSPGALRSFSALWGVAAIPLVYLLAREMFGRRAAVVGSILLVFSSFNIYYSQEAKMYAMWWTLVIASNLFFVRAIKYGARWPDLLLYVVATAASLWTHNFTVLIILSQVIFLVISKPRERMGRWLIAYVLVALIYSPWALTFLAKNLAGPWGEGVGDAITLSRKAIHWIPVPTLRDFVMNFIIFTSGMRLYFYDLGIGTSTVAWHTPFPYSHYLCLLALLLVLYPIIRVKSDRCRFSGLITLMILFPIVAAFIYSHLKTPIWHPRYLGFVSSLIFIAMGYGYSLSDRKLISGTAIGIILVLNLSVLDFYYSDRVKKPWDDLVVYLAPRIESGASVLFPHAEEGKSLEYYWNIDEERRKKILKPEYGYPHWERAKIRERVANFDDVWLILSYTISRAKKQCERARVDVPGYRQERMRFANGLEIVHYTRER